LVTRRKAKVVLGHDTDYFNKFREGEVYTAKGYAT
jgi:hypothetical protein